MFLTTVLLRKRIPGKQWIGKYRQPKLITISMKQAMIRRLEIEAENEYWLSQPYLTQEQEYKHNTEERRAKWEAFKRLKQAKFPEHRYISDHLNHLNVSKKWTCWIIQHIYIWNMSCTTLGSALIPIRGIYCNQRGWQIKLCCGVQNTTLKVVLWNSVCFLIIALLEFFVWLSAICPLPFLQGLNIKLPGAVVVTYRQPSL